MKTSFPQVYTRGFEPRRGRTNNSLRNVNREGREIVLHECPELFLLGFGPEKLLCNEQVMGEYKERGTQAPNPI